MLGIIELRRTVFSLGRVEELEDAWVVVAGDAAELRAVDEDNEDGAEAGSGSDAVGAVVASRVEASIDVDTANELEDEAEDDDDDDDDDAEEASGALGIKIVDNDDNDRAAADGMGGLIIVDLASAFPISINSVSLVTISIFESSHLLLPIAAACCNSFGQLIPMHCATAVSQTLELHRHALSSCDGKHGEFGQRFSWQLSLQGE
ncbi:hypothetical protein MMC06_002668 [Schaereria dolodes]|nr:hypothetical protein [Schaereria dolodes]